jgi:ATP adenylyltransferase
MYMSTEEDRHVSASAGAGTPDGWQRLWAPYRMSYLSGENRPLPGNNVPCPFCHLPTLHDEEALIVARGITCFVVMNLYPYNAGHLLVCTYRHIADLTDLSIEEQNEILALTAHAMKVLRKVSGANGFNLGINQGPVSGAGIADHIHQHVVPRWSGDSNFMPVIGMTKVLPQLLQTTRDALAKNWDLV